jgi:hypothetical protein
MKASVIVSIWLLLTGAIGDALLSPDSPRPAVLLILFQGMVTALTAIALWAEFGEDAPPRRRRMRWHYD